MPLFHRHARGLILTEQGELLYRTAREVFAKLADDRGDADRESKDRPKGPLKVTTTVAFGSTWLTPRIREFLDLYPEIEVTLVVDDSELDLSMREADVAIRMSPPRQPDLIQRQLMKRAEPYSAPRSTSRLPVRPRRRKTSKCTRSSSSARRRDCRRPASIGSRSLQGAQAHAQAGLARQQHLRHATAPCAAASASPPSLTTWSATRRISSACSPISRDPEIDAYFVYPEVLRHSKRIAVFRDFLRQALAEFRLLSGRARGKTCEMCMARLTLLVWTSQRKSLFLEAGHDARCNKAADLTSFGGVAPSGFQATRPGRGSSDPYVSQT